MVLPKNNRPHTKLIMRGLLFLRGIGSQSIPERPTIKWAGFPVFERITVASGFARCLAFLCFRGDGTIRLRPDGDNAGYSGSCGETGAFAPNSAMKICQTVTNSTASVGPVTKPSMPKRERGAKRCRASVFRMNLLDIGFSAMTGQGLSNVRRRKMIKENRKI